MTDINHNKTETDKEYYKVLSNVRYLLDIHQIEKLDSIAASYEALCLLIQHCDSELSGSFSKLLDTLNSEHFGFLETLTENKYIDRSE